MSHKAVEKVTLSQILVERALKTSGKDSAVSGKACDMEKKVMGTGNQKSVWLENRI